MRILSLLPSATEIVYVVDSPTYFSQPGPRTVNGLEILAEIIHPELFSALIPPGAAVELDRRP